MGRNFGHARNGVMISAIFMQRFGEGADASGLFGSKERVAIGWGDRGEL
jgi:hypothetical protein